jgi:hypothetical protein
VSRGNTLRVVEPDERAERYARLQQEHLERAWRADRPGSTEPRVVIALPSYSLDRSVLEHYGDRLGPLENRYLYAMLRAQQPGIRLVYLSSSPVPQSVVDGYLELAPPDTHDTIRRNTIFVSPDDRSSRPLAEKLLDKPHLVETVRRLVGDQPALIEPFTITEAEQELAVALDAPMNGTDPALRKLAWKSTGRKLFRAAGVRIPAGVEDVRSLDEVVAAVRSLRAEQPSLAGVVVKLDDSVAGDGNVVLRFAELSDGDRGLRELVNRSLAPWYVDTLRRGGVVEELIVGRDFCSPSGQMELCPDGVVEVVSTHDQRLGGEHGQVFEGCTFPARAPYAAEIAEQSARVGEALVASGAIGRVSVDFAAVRGDDGWDLYALEINLRKGGTTHPYGITRLLTGGHYDARSGCFSLEDGSARCYGATDNLVDEGWHERSPVEVRRRLAESGVAFDTAARVGVIPHLLDCLAVDGRMGYTAIGRSREEVDELEARIVDALC